MQLSLVGIQSLDHIGADPMRVGTPTKILLWGLLWAFSEIFEGLQAIVYCLEPLKNFTENLISAKSTQGAAF